MPHPFPSRANPASPDDVGWLAELVHTLANVAVSRAELVAFLGEPAGSDMWDEKRELVRPLSPLIESAVVYPLSHIGIDVAVDLQFQEGSALLRESVERALGELRAMPRAPDDFSSGPKLAYRREGAHGTARVFVELHPSDETRVRSIHLDVDGVRQRS